MSEYWICKDDHAVLSNGDIMAIYRGETEGKPKFRTFEEWRDANFDQAHIDDAERYILIEKIEELAERQIVNGERILELPELKRYFAKLLHKEGYVDESLPENHWSTQASLHGWLPPSAEHSVAFVRRVIEIVDTLLRKAKINSGECNGSNDEYGWHLWVSNSGNDLDEIAKLVTEVLKSE